MKSPKSNNNGCASICSLIQKKITRIIKDCVAFVLGRGPLMCCKNILFKKPIAKITATQSFFLNCD